MCLELGRSYIVSRYVFMFMFWIWARRFAIRGSIRAYIHILLASYFNSFPVGISVDIHMSASQDRGRATIHGKNKRKTSKNDDNATLHKKCCFKAFAVFFWVRFRGGAGHWNTDHWVALLLHAFPYAFSFIFFHGWLVIACIDRCKNLIFRCSHPRPRP